MTPYQKIMRAYNDADGVRGVRLTPDDVVLLGADNAIETRAQLDSEDQCLTTGRHAKRDGAGFCIRCGGKDNL